ncbi:unnamed protein product [Nesidiocoris tenuis]|uniref:Uncharacterized protein n=1 Tax=Nesidiocoris tenuis TaxID=355587 RepID=A0A6H5H6D0_9HEMI|nr:unnamed protein product [Nesidiocoris tenuis]
MPLPTYENAIPGKRKGRTERRNGETSAIRKRKNLTKEFCIWKKLEICKTLFLVELQKITIIPLLYTPGEENLEQGISCTAQFTRNRTDNEDAIRGICTKKIDRTRTAYGGRRKVYGGRRTAYRGRRTEDGGRRTADGVRRTAAEVRRLSMPNYPRRARETGAPLLRRSSAAAHRLRHPLQGCRTTEGLRARRVLKFANHGVDDSLIKREYHEVDNPPNCRGLAASRQITECPLPHREDKSAKISTMQGRKGGFSLRKNAFRQPPLLENDAMCRFPKVHIMYLTRNRRWVI